MKIRILFVIPILDEAGAEKHLLNLFENLNKRDFEPMICCIKGYGSLGEKLSLEGRNIIALNRKSVYDFRIIKDLFILMRKHKFDIVHSYLFGFDLLATFPARISGIRCVISSRRELSSWMKFYHRWLLNLSNCFTDHVVACSNAARDYALSTERFLKNKIVTIYNGVDTVKFYPRHKNPKIMADLDLGDSRAIVGMITKFALVKDYKTAFEAIAKVKDKYPDLKFIVAGSGGLYSQACEYANAIGIDVNVRFCGKRTDVEELLSVFDIFILSSLTEGLPNVILEAMSSGLAVVATNVGGIPEAVEDGKSGILFNPKDSQALKAAIIKLIEDVALSREMGVYGRKIAAAKFNLIRMVSDYEVFYKKAVS